MTTTTYPASPKQTSFIATLLKDREVPADYAKLASAPFSSKEASTIISHLLAQPRKPQTAAATIPFEGIAKLLQTAKTHLKFPKVRLQTPDGKRVVIGMAGDRAKHPGSLNVTDGGHFGENVWYGRILTDGTYEGHAPADVIDLLTRFAADPATVAGELGRLIGNCCFCGLPLSDERSTAVGYGQTCAGHYGLPWGKATSEEGA